MFASNNRVEVIQLMLLPGLILSTSGLIIIGMNIKYYIVVNRIRLLKYEKRKVLMRSENSETVLWDSVR